MEIRRELGIGEVHASQHEWSCGAVRREKLKIVFDDKMESRAPKIWEVTLQTIETIPLQEWTVGRKHCTLLLQRTPWPSVCTGTTACAARSLHYAALCAHCSVACFCCVGDRCVCLVCLKLDTDRCSKKISGPSFPTASTRS